MQENIHIILNYVKKLIFTKVCILIKVGLCFKIINIPNKVNYVHYSHKLKF